MALTGRDQATFFGLDQPKKLKYIHTAKQLNSRQAGWSLFLTHFVFYLSYRTGSRTVKPDALSCQFLEKEDLATSQLPAGSPLSSGRLRNEYGPPQRTNPAPALLIACLFLQISDPTFFCGPTIPS